MASKGPLTWDGVKKFDDIILPVERKLISELEKNAFASETCPILRKEGEFFYYCGKGIPVEISGKVPPYVGHPIYKSHVDTAELQLHCLKEYKSCCFYQGKLPPKAGNIKKSA